MTSVSVIENLPQIIEAAIMVAGRPLSKNDLLKLFDETEQPSAADMQNAIQTLQERYQASGVELREVASGFQFQAKTEYSAWLTRLWEERPTRYSRAFLETLALIAYRQPITRAEIEEIRGVTVSTNIIKTLSEREWIRVIGYKDVPGKPAIYGTTKTFLDDFNLKALDQLPTLAEIKDLETQVAKLQVQLELAHTEEAQENTATEATEVQHEESSTETTLSAEDISEEISSDSSVDEVSEDISADSSAESVSEEVTTEETHEEELHTQETSIDETSDEQTTVNHE